MLPSDIGIQKLNGLGSPACLNGYYLLFSNLIWPFAAELRREGDICGKSEKGMRINFYSFLF